jgi:hypothetical protein
VPYKEWPELDPRLTNACKPEHFQLPTGRSSHIKLLIKSGSAMSGNFCTSSAKEIRGEIFKFLIAVLMGFPGHLQSKHFKLVLPNHSYTSTP